MVRPITASANNIGVKTSAKFRGLLLTAGSDAASIIVYDSTTQAGEIFAQAKAPAGTSFFMDLTADISVKTGISVTVTGTSPLAYLYFE